MEALNIIQTIASVLSLILTLFVTNQVVSIKKTMNEKSKTEVIQSNNQIGGNNSRRDIKN